MLKHQKKTYVTTIFEVAKWFLCKENMPSGKLQALCYYAYFCIHSSIGFIYFIQI